jgi:branched-subunit amino acid transport protein
MSVAAVWGVILALGVGTFLIRFSFLGLIGRKPLPEWVLRHLRYTAVAVLPALSHLLFSGPRPRPVRLILLGSLPPGQ